MPPFPTLNSRMDVSCEPVRFFRTEMARRISPSASKYLSSKTVSER